MKYLRFLCAVVLMSIVSIAYATDESVSISIGDKEGNALKIVPGKSVDAYVFLTNANPMTDENPTGVKLMCSMTVWMQFPEGLSLAGTPELVEDNWTCPNSSASFDVSDPDGWWYITNSDNTYYKDCFVKKASGAILKFTIQAEETIELGEATVTIGAFYITKTTGDEAFVIDDYENETQTFAVAVEEASAETVEIALGNASGYNTYVSDKDLDFTGLDAKAYIVSAVSATEATLKAVTTIKAGEGFIIEGAGEATIEVPVAAETPAASGTLLATGQPSEGDYLLATDGSAFVLWNGEGTLAATKAYLPASAISSGAKIINIAFGESTGISEVKKSEADSAIYNLSGMRVSKTQKGVYIMNGRKVIVK